MEKEDARKQSPEAQFERRKQVIRLFRKGEGVMRIVELTVISSSAVDDRSVRGRRFGCIEAESAR